MFLVRVLKNCNAAGSAPHRTDASCYVPHKKLSWKRKPHRRSRHVHEAVGISVGISERPSESRRSLLSGLWFRKLERLVADCGI